MAEWFHDDIVGNVAYNKPEIPVKGFKYKDKNLEKNFTNFLNGKLSRPDQIFHLKPPATMRAQLNKTSDHVNHLVKEIGDITKYKIEQEAFFYTMTAI